MPGHTARNLPLPADPHCDACLNGWEDLNPWDGVDYCECCEMWLCGYCYAYLH